MRLMSPVKSWGVKWDATQRVGLRFEPSGVHSAPHPPRSIWPASRICWDEFVKELKPKFMPHSSDLRGCDRTIAYLCITISIPQVKLVRHRRMALDELPYLVSLALMKVLDDLPSVVILALMWALTEPPPVARWIPEEGWLPRKALSELPV